MEKEFTKKETKEQKKKSVYRYSNSMGSIT